jgi:tetratricopeptide (TPR) repeat protein
MPEDEIQHLKNKLRALRNKPDKGVSGRKKVDILNDLAFALYKSDPKKTGNYARRAFTLAEKLDYKKGIARGYLIFGLPYWIKGDYNKAIDYYQSALGIYEEINDEYGIANSYHNIGTEILSQGFKSF